MWRMAQRKKTKNDGTAREMSGPKCVYRGKIRQPMTYKLTAAGHQMLQKTIQRTGLSQSDLIEALLRQFGDRVAAADVSMAS